MQFSVGVAFLLAAQAGGMSYGSEVEICGVGAVWGDCADALATKTVGPEHVRAVCDGFLWPTIVRLRRTLELSELDHGPWPKPQNLVSPPRGNSLL